MPLRATCSALLLALLSLSFSLPLQDGASLPQDREVFLEQYCLRCHGGERTKGGFEIAELRGQESSTRWSDVADRLEWGEMPPAGEPRPSDEELVAFLAFAIEEGKDAGPAALQAAPRALRRLGNQEYRNAVLDLLDVDIDVSEFLPPDDVAHGYDVVGEALSLTPTHLERYLIAAERIAARAIVLPEEAEPNERLVESPDFELSRDFQQYLDSRKGIYWRALTSSGSAGARYTVETDGPYVLRVRATADQAGSNLAAFDVRVNGVLQSRHEVPVERPEERILEVPLKLIAGEHLIEVAFVNDYYKPKAKDPSDRDRNLLLASLCLVGPMDRTEPSRLQREWTATGAKLEEAAIQLATRLFRRPVEKREVRPFLKLSKRAQSFDERLRAALTGMLVSPHFLMTGAEPGDYHLAAGLAWFLWRSAPDDELLEAAREGRLQNAAGRRAAVTRMLRAARATSLAENFASQWLQLGRIAEVAPDPRRFADFDEALREAMRAETLHCFEAVLREERPVQELIASDWTFVNARLAKHYGFPAVEGSAMRRVPVPGAFVGRRGGLLGQAGPLCVTSNPTRTSPVKRGKWILEALLDSAPPPPPPGVDDLAENEEARDQASLRERMEQHRERPECASCHRSMDALGLGLENYDAIGRWREKDGRHEIDAAAELPDGRSFEGPRDLRSILRADRAFLRALTKNLAIYALGRGLEREDEIALSKLLQQSQEEPTLKDLILGVVELPGFLTGGLADAASEGQSR